MPDDGRRLAGVWVCGVLTIMAFSGLPTSRIEAQTLFVARDAVEELGTPVKAGGQLLVKPRGIVVDGLRMRIFRGSKAILGREPHLGTERVGETSCWIYDSVVFAVPSQGTGGQWLVVKQLDPDRWVGAAPEQFVVVFELGDVPDGVVKIAESQVRAYFELGQEITVQPGGGSVLVLQNHVNDRRSQAMLDASRRLCIRELVAGVHGTLAALASECAPPG